MIPAFYPIIDTGACRDRGVAPLDVAAACLDGGARLLQLRFKSGPGAEFLELTERLVSLARPFDAAVVVNDRADLARMAGAAGVHVGQEDLPVEDVRRLLGPAAIVGVSTHTSGQVDEASRTSATYVAVGPVFETSTKQTGYTARGLDLVRHAAGSGKPVVAIGGITLGNAASVYAAGAASIAVIGGLFDGKDITAQVTAFVRLAPGSTS